MVEELTDEQVLHQLQALANTATVEEAKHNAHTFLNAVATAEDTTRVGNLKEEEVGIPVFSQRTLKELALYCRDIGGEDEWAEFLDKRAEILTATSLSKDAKLLDTAVIQRTEVGPIARKPPRRTNKSWFKKKQPGTEV